MKEKTTLNPINYLLAICFLVFYLIVGYNLPITQDEAYYYVWSRSLSWGYFDHPPLIAFIIWTGHLLSPIFSFELATRIIPSIFAVGIGIVVAKQASFVFENKKIALYSQILTNSSLAGLMMGVLATPDIAVAFFWCLGFHYSNIALNTNLKRFWLYAGIATGIGILGKYTMVLIGPVYLLGLLAINKRQLFTPWPYLGGVLCFLITLPNFNWNFANNWHTISFQFGHGLGAKKPEIDHAFLPRAKSGTADNTMSLKKRIGFVSPKPTPPQIKGHSGSIEPESKHKPKRKKTVFEKKIQNSLDFIGAQIGLWGFLGFFLLIFSFSLFRKRKRRQFISEIRTNPRYLYTLIACAFPLGFFLIWTLKSKVEGNWAAMYMVSFAIIFSRIAFKRNLTILALATANLCLFILVAYHANNPISITNSKKDRVLQETHGYEQLANYLFGFKDFKVKTFQQTRNQPIFVDSYQIVSMLRYYRNKKLHSYGIENLQDKLNQEIRYKVDQWPGITRPSHLIIDSRIQDISFQEFARLNSFRIVSTDKYPPVVPGFRPIYFEKISDCIGEFKIEQTSLPEKTSFGCAREVHCWFVSHYQRDISTASN